MNTGIVALLYLWVAAVMPFVCAGCKSQESATVPAAGSGVSEGTLQSADEIISRSLKLSDGSVATLVSTETFKISDNSSVVVFLYGTAGNTTCCSFYTPTPRPNYYSFIEDDFSTWPLRSISLERQNGHAFIDLIRTNAYTRRSVSYSYQFVYPNTLARTMSTFYYKTP